MTTAPAAVSTALQLNDVRKVYTMGDGSEVVALDHATLTLGSDEMVALVGPSGSGKTTLCSIAGGILSATEGTIVVGGEDISDHDAKELTKFRQEKVGFVFQSVNLVPFLNARENLLVVDELGKRTGAPAKARADQLLEELGLADRAKNLPSQLSGGQRQRVAIGRALMNDPALVLLFAPLPVPRQCTAPVRGSVSATAKRASAARWIIWLALNCSIVTSSVWRP